MTILQKDKSFTGERISRGIKNSLFCTCFWIAGLMLLFLPENVPAESNSALSDQTRIVGGKTAEVGAWPWMVAVLKANEEGLYDAQFCGGALIASTWVLTAAHCVYDDNANLLEAGDIDVALGVHNLQYDTGDRIGVKRIIVHPGYDYENNFNDIALFELKRPSTAATLALFTDSGNNLAGETGIAIGWGKTSSIFEIYATELQQVELPVVSNAVCNSSYPGQITSGMLCSGYAFGGKDACQGDSGGPLMVSVNGVWKHAGIISWGEGCALAGFYGVNTRTSHYLSFIRSYVNLDTSSPEEERDGSLALPAVNYLLLDSTAQ